jgi:hypothetical protein
MVRQLRESPPQPSGSRLIGSPLFSQVNDSETIPDINSETVCSVIFEQWKTDHLLDQQFIEPIALPEQGDYFAETICNKGGAGLSDKSVNLIDIRDFHRNI